ncbi:MAG: HAMP domain-containing histidine kinase [Clostridia bacterium]|nr:HAMP domain-containing histidine kinase [Clostridia bacterium]
MNRLSLRLSAAIAAVFLLALLLSGLLTYAGVKRQMELAARTQAEAVVQTLRRTYAEPEDGQRDQHADPADGDFLAGVPPGIEIVIRDGSGRVVNATSPGAVRLLPGTGIQSAGESLYWVIRKPLDRDGRLIVTVGVPFGGAWEFLELLRARLLMIGAGSGLAVLAVVFLLVRAKLRPLRELAQAARQLGQGDWGRRFDARGSPEEVAALGQSFNDMADRLEAAFERQRTFVADAAHELRTPVAILDGYTRMLQRWGKSDPRVLDESLDAMSTETAYMAKLVQKLLAASRDGRSAAEPPTAFHLDDLLAQVVSATRLLGRERDVAVRLGTIKPLTVKGDPDAMREALLAVIENAIKFTKPGTAVEVSCEASGDAARVVVRDQGPGIAPEALPHIFERFFKADRARARHIEGTGLGLSIASDLMKSQGGRVYVLETSPTGTAFALELPLFS